MSQTETAARVAANRRLPALHRLQLPIVARSALCVAGGDLLRAPRTHLPTSPDARSLRPPRRHPDEVTERLGQLIELVAHASGPITRRPLAGTPPGRRTCD